MSGAGLGGWLTGLLAPGRSATAAKVGAQEAAQALLDAEDVARIELYLLRRIGQSVAGDHASVRVGSGFDLAELRHWEPGDAVSSIDWAQSSLTNFSPLVTRQFEEHSNATILVVADASLSASCGANGTPIKSAILRGLAAIGLAAAFFQDRFGLIAFDARMQCVATAAPRVGRPHVIHCLDSYRGAAAIDTGGADVFATIEAFGRRPALLVVISDFLFANAAEVVERFAASGAVHDVILLMVDASFAFEFPDTTSGWIEVYDIETGATRVLSRREASRLVERVGEWQRSVERLARAKELDIVTAGADRWQMEHAMLGLLEQRRARKLRS